MFSIIYHQLHISKYQDQNSANASPSYEMISHQYSVQEIAGKVATGSLTLYMYIRCLCVGAYQFKYNHCLFNRQPMDNHSESFSDSENFSNALSNEVPFLQAEEGHSLQVSGLPSQAPTERSGAPHDPVAELMQRIRNLNQEIAESSRGEGRQGHRVDRANYKAKKFIRILKSEFDQMPGGQYDFMYSCDTRNYNDSHFKKNEVEIQRWVKIKFKCKNCRGEDMDDETADSEEQAQSHQSQDNRPVLPFKQQKTWTSFYGLVSFKFFFDTIPRNIVPQREQNLMNYPFVLRFQFHIHEQECEECRRTGGSFILDESNWILRDTYVTIIELVLAKYRNPIRRPNFDTQVTKGRNKEGNRSRPTVERDISHRDGLCEACRLGKCRYRRRNRRGFMIRGRYR